MLHFKSSRGGNFYITARMPLEKKMFFSSPYTHFLTYFSRSSNSYLNMLTKPDAVGWDEPPPIPRTQEKNSSTSKKIKLNKDKISHSLRSSSQKKFLKLKKLINKILQVF